MSLQGCSESGVNQVLLHNNINFQMKFIGTLHISLYVTMNALVVQNPCHKCDLGKQLGNDSVTDKEITADNI